MSELPDPLTPLDCDLRDFPFMPLEIQRLRRSKTWLKAKRNPALAFYQINLWTAAWHDVPAGSLEDDEDVLADLAMCDPAKWEKVRADVMRGWIKCSDGRLYNPTVCEKAIESWASKKERLARDEHERDRKRREREERSKMFEALKSAGITPAWNTNTTDLRKLVTDLSRGQVTDRTVTSPPEVVTDSGQSRLREGQGQGEGQVNNKPPIPPKGGEIQESKKRPTVALKTFLEKCKASGEKPIPETDTVFDYATKTCIPSDFLRLHWLEFKARYAEEGAKRYKDWRAVFRKSVRGNWFKLWWISADGTCALTTVGEQAKRAHGKDAA